MIDKFMPAFMGAFFAFIFIRIAEMLTKLYERLMINYNSLVRIEYLCVRNVDRISTNLFIIDDFIGFVEKSLEGDYQVVYGNLLHQIPFNEELILDLTSIEFINEALSYKADVDRVNHDCETLFNVYNDFKSSIINEGINKEVYNINVKRVVEQLKELRKFLVALEGRTEIIAAKAKVLSRASKPLFTKFVHKVISKDNLLSNLKNDIDKEVKQIKIDRQTISDESQKEIERVKSSL